MMTARELVSRAIEFRNPERLPFCQVDIPEFPNDVTFCAAMTQAFYDASVTFHKPRAA